MWQCPPKTVLVAVDFGEASARALAIGGVLATDGDRSSWAITDAVARVLHACERPVLFVPAQ